MSLPVFLGCLWVLCSTVVATLPMRFQYAPGLCLLLAAPVLLFWIGSTHGMWLFFIGMFAFVSMFRHPLRFLGRRAVSLFTGKNDEVPS
ncbi:MAG: DUF2484 family protein [Boseongicola sp.]|nr:DUF2484 family protein [Boseongicola sp.]